MLKLVIFLAVVACALSPAVSRSLDGRIFEGSDADIESYPYTVQLLTFNGLHFCGGVIYSKNIIITSGLCLALMRVKTVTVLAGSTWKNTSDFGIAAPVRVIHEDFNFQTKANDIALLRLENDLVYSPAIRNIELATEAPADGTDAIVLGWGAILRNGAAFSERLQLAEVNIVNNSNCASLNYWYYDRISSSMICAVGDGSDFCANDDGGPLVANDKLVGIASWTHDHCGSAKQPGVYTDIAQFLPWIKETAARMISDI